MPYYGNVYYPEVGDSVEVWNEGFEGNAVDAKKGWNGTTLTTYGDSITAGGAWQPLLNDIIGFGSIENQGVAGSRISGEGTGMCQDSRIDLIPDSDLILINGGVNDWGNDVVMGFETRANIINSTNLEITEGFEIDWITGNLGANPDAICSEFYYPLVDGETYTFENIARYALYNSGKVRLDGGLFGAIGKNDVVATSGSGGVAYVRVSWETEASGWSPYPCVYKKDIEDQFKPAISLMISKIQMRQPRARIIILGTTYAKTPNKTTGTTPFTDLYGLKNNLGLKTTDYAGAMEEMARYCGVPFIDMALWGDENVHVFTSDGVHPQITTGDERIADAVAGGLEKVGRRSELQKG